MHILWIGKKPVSGDAGDEVFDRKMIAALKLQGHNVDLRHPAPVTKPQELVNLARLVPHYRARFASKRNRDLASDLRGQFDVSICSWEPLDVLVPHLPKPVIVIAHNVTSLALPQMFPNNRLVKLAAYRARLWENRIYRREHLLAVATLSQRDFDRVSNIPGGATTLLTIPGMPLLAPLASSAPLLGEIVLTGTYDWAPKRRDIARFLQEFAALPDRPPLLTAAVTAQMTAGLGIQTRPLPSNNGDALRFGLITDRFEAGHKLKTLAYIADNQIVLSYTDVACDFTDVEDAAFFLRRVTSAADINAHIAQLSAMDLDQLRTRFTAFQRRCADTYTWQAAAARLTAVMPGAGQPKQPVTAATLA